MNKYSDLTRLRSESDIKLAKAYLRHAVMVHEREISDCFRNFSELLVTTVKMAVLQAGTRMITAALIRLLQSRSK